jgi:hypothetical protein
LTLVEAYLRRTGMPPTKFGRAAARDPRLVHDLRLGRTVGDRLRQRVVAYIDGQAV